MLAIPHAHRFVRYEKMSRVCTLLAAGERHTSPLDVAALERLIQRPS